MKTTIIRSLFLMTLFVVLMGGFSVSTFVSGGPASFPPLSPIIGVHNEGVASPSSDWSTLFTCFEGPGPMPTPTNPPSGMLMK